VHESLVGKPTNRCIAAIRQQLGVKQTKIEQCSIDAHDPFRIRTRSGCGAAMGRVGADIWYSHPGIKSERTYRGCASGPAIPMVRSAAGARAGRGADWFSATSREHGAPQFLELINGHRLLLTRRRNRLPSCYRSYRPRLASRLSLRASDCTLPVGSPANFSRNRSGR
jgi:hypothetical protein